MAKSRTKKQSGKSNVSQLLLPVQGRLLWILAIAAGAAAIIFFLGKPILETFGFGLFLGLIWVGCIIWVLWQRRVSSLIRWWNIWLGALFFTLAIWGIFSLFYPSGLAIGNADFSDVSLGGSAGKSFIGNEGVGAPPGLRLAILIIAGTAIIVPRPSYRFLQLFFKYAKSAGAEVIVAAKWLFPRLARLFSNLNNKFPLGKLLATPLIALKSKLRLGKPSEPEAGEESGEGVAVSPETEAV
jgi:hypothetical protein